MTDRNNFVYFDDANNTWFVKNLAAYLVNLGFVLYDPVAHAGMPALPSGFRMREINMSFTTPSGQVRRRTFPCGNLANKVYKGESTFTLKVPGIATGGTVADAIDFVYSTSSTRGEIRSFITTTNPGYAGFVANDNITSVTPTP